MDSIMQEVMPFILSIVGVVGSLILFILGKTANNIMEKYNIKQELKNNEQIVKMSVEYVQQVYWEMDGAEKLKRAKEKALSLMATRGMNITSEELEALIEQAVLGFKKGMEQDVNVKEVVTLGDTEIEQLQNTVGTSFKYNVVENDEQ